MRCGRLPCESPELEGRERSHNQRRDDVNLNDRRGAWKGASTACSGESFDVNFYYIKALTPQGRCAGASHGQRRPHDHMGKLAQQDRIELAWHSAHHVIGLHGTEP